MISIGGLKEKHVSVRRRLKIHGKAKSRPKPEDQGVLGCSICQVSERLATWDKTPT